MKMSPALPEPGMFAPGRCAILPFEIQRWIAQPPIAMLMPRFEERYTINTELG